MFLKKIIWWSTLLCWHLIKNWSKLHCTGRVACSFTPQVKQARNQSPTFNRKSISRNTTHRLSYHLQAMLTGVKRWKTKTRSKKVTASRLQWRKRTTPTVQIKQEYTSCSTTCIRWSFKTCCKNNKNLLLFILAVSFNWGSNSEKQLHVSTKLPTKCTIKESRWSHDIAKYPSALFLCSFCVIF